MLHNAQWINGADKRAKNTCDGTERGDSTASWIGVTCPRCLRKKPPRKKSEDRPEGGL